MPFFDPLPEPPAEHWEQTEQTWSSPLWDRPSEGTLPTVVGVSQLFARTEKLALAFDELRVYPNGFQLVISALTSPRLPPELQMLGMHSFSLIAAEGTATGDDNEESSPPLPARRLRPSMLMNGPRIGVQFGSGQRAGGRYESPFDVRKDEAGIPTEPVILGGGGGGSGSQFRWEHWVFPLPGAGPLTVFAEWAASGIEETSLVISGDDVRDAATRAVVLWS